MHSSQIMNFPAHTYISHLGYTNTLKEGIKETSSCQCTKDFLPGCMEIILTFHC